VGVVQQSVGLGQRRRWHGAAGKSRAFCPGRVARGAQPAAAELLSEKGWPIWAARLPKPQGVGRQASFSN
jgi:hypothetical protein